MQVFSEPWKVDVGMPPPARPPPKERLEWQETGVAEEACKEWFAAVEDYLRELHDCGASKDQEGSWAMPLRG